jgi:hypothetical protein
MTDPTGPPIHEAVEPIGFLLGTWRGTGEGSYPTIESFRYNEEITFSHVGKPFLAYTQKTRHADTGMPLHAESGYWRPIGGGRMEVVLAHPTGIMESLAGAFVGGDTGGTFMLRCPEVGLTESAVTVTETSRRFEIQGDELTYDVAMAAVGQPLTHHLSATLRRAE